MDNKMIVMSIVGLLVSLAIVAPLVFFTAYVTDAGSEASTVVETTEVEQVAEDMVVMQEEVIQETHDNQKVEESEATNPGVSFFGEVDEVSDEESEQMRSVTTSSGNSMRDIIKHSDRTSSAVPPPPSPN